MEYWWGRGRILPVPIVHHPGATGMASSSLAAATNLTMKLELAPGEGLRGVFHSCVCVFFF